MSQKSSLANTSIVVTRPTLQNQYLCQHLTTLGAKAIQFPCIEINPYTDLDSHELQQQVRESEILIFISANAVNCAFSTIPQLNAIISEQHCVAAVGNSTKQALQHYGIQKIFTPEVSSDSEGLLKLDVLQRVKGKLALIFKGSGGRELLFDTLQARGAKVQNIELYQRGIAKSVDISAISNKIDLILFTSRETVDNFLTLTPDSLQESLLTCQTIVGHPRIAEKVSSLGFKKLPIIAASPSDADMLAAIHGWLETR